MPTQLPVLAVEESTYTVKVEFTDELDAPVMPNVGTLTWTLLKKVGRPPVATVVNGRLNVAIASAATVTVVLTGDDLAIVEGESKTRYLLFEGTYDSSLGSGLPFKHQVTFSIENLVGVPE